MLKRLLAPLAALALLGGCALLTNPPGSPKNAAEQTIVDERVALGVETMYQGWTVFAETALDLDLVKDEERLLRVAEFDRRIYAYVQVARAAYDAGNSASYAEAVQQVTELIAEATTLVRGDTK